MGIVIRGYEPGDLPGNAADAEPAAALERTCFEGAAHTPWTASQFLAEFAAEAL